MTLRGPGLHNKPSNINEETEALAAPPDEVLSSAKTGGRGGGSARCPLTDAPVCPFTDVSVCPLSDMPM